jgi:hypothetical protein
MSERSQVRIGLTPVVLWCLPSLLGFLGFLLAFPISRDMFLGQHQNIAEGLFYWFLTIAPAATIVAMVRLNRRSRFRKMQGSHKAIAWGLIVFSIFLNGFVLVGLGAAFYF